MSSLVDPKIDDTRVPWCDGGCPSWDGKRCRILGHRPELICIPAIRDMAAAIAENSSSKQTQGRLTTPQAGVTAGIPYYLVERQGYWCDFGSSVWVNDASKATRFTRRSSAEHAMFHSFGDDPEGIGVTEHIDVSAPGARE